MPGHRHFEERFPLSKGMLALNWPARKAEFKWCAAAVTETLGLLNTVGFTTFRQLGRSRRDAERSVFEPTSQAVTALLIKGANRTDVGRQPMPELGWRLSLWSGGPDEAAFGFSVHCGCYSEWVGNNVRVGFPRSGPRELAQQLDEARSRYRILVGLWQPEQATLCLGSIKWTDRVLTPAGVCVELLQRGARGNDEV